MGNRVAELSSGGFHDMGDIIGWAVYQSTSMSLFTPIFSSQLAAELFAAVLMDIFPNWEDMHLAALALDVNTFLTGALGEQPEEHEDYTDFLDLEELRTGLVAQLREYRRSVRKAEVK